MENKYTKKVKGLMNSIYKKQMKVDDLLNVLFALNEDAGTDMISRLQERM